jgi:hypothetical protein
MRDYSYSSSSSDFKNQKILSYYEITAESFSRICFSFIFFVQLINLLTIPIIIYKVKIIKIVNRISL